MRDQIGGKVLGIDATTLKLFADKLVESKNPVEWLLAAVLYKGSANGIPEGQIDAVTTQLLVDHSLFQCSKCHFWRSTNRIDPDKEEWCISCSQEHKENNS